MCRHDTSQPIEINADSLEVLQDEQVAVFRGNVDAVQGGIRLKADELRVHYRTENTDSGGDIAGSIMRIDATGSVFVSSASETAPAGGATVATGSWCDWSAGSKHGSFGTTRRS